MEEVSYVSGKTRLYAIVGDPIEQVRSPEMVTAELVGRGLDAVLVPMHVLPHEFDTVLPALMKTVNLDGLIFTIPYKARACALVDELGAQARVVGAINAMGRMADGRWRGDIFDGRGCVAAFKRRGQQFAGKRVMLIGAGGAGAAIGVAIAAEQPAAMRLFDLDPAKVQALTARIRQVAPQVQVTHGEPQVQDIDILLNATPTGMLGDPRLPIAATTLPASLVVFDAIVKPEDTPLLKLAAACGCQTIRGREMMRGQIASIVDYFISGQAPSSV